MHDRNIANLPRRAKHVHGTVARQLAPALHGIRGIAVLPVVRRASHASDCIGPTFLTFAVRGVSLCLQTGRRMAEHFPDPQTPFYWHEPPRAADAPAIIAIPSTLSAAEATFGGGVTHEHRKRSRRRG